VLDQVRMMLPDMLDLEKVSFQRTDWNFGVYVASILEKNGEWNAAFIWYQSSLQLLQTLRTYNEDQDARIGMG
jgi:hypothetical protein